MRSGWAGKFPSRKIWSTLGSHVQPEVPVTHWIWSGFLSVEVCVAIRAAMDRGASDPAEILEDAIERSEEHTSELQSQSNVVCRLLLEKKNQLNDRRGP